ncbi:MULTISPECIES: competence protein CoiA family protein [Anaeromyxobacter]|uniref:hypothetical protein n=1 Tax=Anaeromyxobacter TaxID=161492 RepID=UPI001F579FE2|nr:MULTISPECIES: hypothetical protein [unclassified Anaeromyxobacter]
MFFADDGSGARVEAWPKASAVCPLCRRVVRARCGEVVDWYWAHERGASCDTWAESETPWHHWWKLRAEPDQREVVMGEHRADIRTPKGVIELQHSPIAPEEIREREAFYGRMIWLLDGRRMVFGLNEFGLDDVARIERVDVPPWGGLPPPPAGFAYWLWRRPRTSFLAAKKRLFIDLGEEVLEVADKQASRKEGFLLLGRMERRDHFLNRAGLRPLDTTEEERVLSLLVRYLPKDHGRAQDRPGFHWNDKGPSRRWREFATGAQLERWRTAWKPAEHEVFEWHSSGRLAEREEET